MLKKQEYEILNRIIKIIYQSKTSEGMRHQVLINLKELIRFQFSVFSLGVLKNKSVYLADSTIVSDFERKFEERFLYLSETKYDAVDYASWIFQISESVVYKDSEVVSNSLRKKTAYYKDYLLANGLPHAAGLSIVHEAKFLGALTLYKNKKTGDFSEKDLFILDFLRPHLESRLATDDRLVQSNKKNISYLLRSKYHMTSREIEITGLVFKGLKNDEIANRLAISENTVKKHISHIYDKLGLAGRPQLIQFILDSDMAHLW